MEIKKVGPEAIPVIRLLAHEIWAVTYKDILSPAQMGYMLDQIYSREALQKQMEEHGHQFALLTDDEKTAGFASWSVKTGEDTSVYKLHKIYIDTGSHGKGMGKFLLDYILHDIRGKGATGLELNVNRENKALGFYQRSGFEIIEEQDIPIGNGYFMNDYVMRLGL